MVKHDFVSRMSRSIHDLRLTLQREWQYQSLTRTSQQHNPFINLGRWRRGPVVWRVDTAYLRQAKHNQPNKYDAEPLLVCLYDFCWTQTICLTPAGCCRGCWRNLWWMAWFAWQPWLWGEGLTQSVREQILCFLVCIKRSIVTSVLQSCSKYVLLHSWFLSWNLYRVQCKPLMLSHPEMNAGHWHFMHALTSDYVWSQHHIHFSWILSPRSVRSWYALAVLGVNTTFLTNDVHFLVSKKILSRNLHTWLLSAQPRLLPCCFPNFKHMSTDTTHTKLRAANEHNLHR